MKTKTLFLAAVLFALPACNSLKDGEYSLSMGYLASWMQRMCQE